MNDLISKGQVILKGLQEGFLEPVFYIIHEK